MASPPPRRRLCCKQPAPLAAAAATPAERLRLEQERRAAFAERQADRQAVALDFLAKQLESVRAQASSAKEEAAYHRGLLKGLEEAAEARTATARAEGRLAGVQELMDYVVRRRWVAPKVQVTDGSTPSECSSRSRSRRRSRERDATGARATGASAVDVFSPECEPPQASTISPVTSCNSPSAGSSSQDREADHLPAGWKLCVSKTLNRPYYFNGTQSLWKLPAGSVEAESPPPGASRGGPDGAAH